ncbi:hypothetical protein Mgra_00000569 [Meloidogyne graminicola]|uniref:Uncharacterized protein n=1 Tax=Meloidogyne graminicola TaxID=189291 RepID=A0A8T0A3K5_9BILA|nr:hypothetical protein Mgra_00000569 [Meloidogyne graminicola]
MTRHFILFSYLYFFNNRSLTSVIVQIVFVRNCLEERESKIWPLGFDPVICFCYISREPEKDSDYNNFQLTDELKIKWQNAIQNEMPLYKYYPHSIARSRFDMVDNNYKDNNSAYLLLLSKDKDKVPNLRLKLQHPQNIEQMLNLRYWFNKLSKCYFENIVVEQAVFSSDMINLLFDGMSKLIFNAKTFFMYGNHCIYGYTFMNNHIVSKGVYLENKSSFTRPVSQLFGKKIKEEECRVSITDFGLNESDDDEDNPLPEFARVADYEFVHLKTSHRRGSRIYLIYEVGSNNVSEILHVILLNDI